MKIYLLLFFLLISCSKNKEESDQGEIDKTVKNYLVTDVFNDTNIQLDSLWQHSRDTITDKLEAEIYSVYAMNEIKRLSEEGEKDRADMKLYIAIEALDLIEIKRPKLQKTLDSMKYFENLMDKSFEKVNTADSTKVNGYLVNYVFKIRDKTSNRSRQDTIELVVLKDFSIMKPYDYIKLITPKITKP